MTAQNCDQVHGCAPVQVLNDRIETNVMPRLENLEKEDKKLHDRITAGIQKAVDRAPANTQTVAVVVLQLLTILAMVLIAVFKH